MTYALTGLLLQVILNLSSLGLKIDLKRLVLDTLSGQDRLCILAVAIMFK